MKLFDQSHFQIMPWKNGGGSTLELFSLRKSNGDILFRLSSADVKQDGPFSHFPNIDRHLFLLEGEGIKLTFPDKVVKMDKILEPIIFAGEEPIHCELINGACLDFNVMTDRHFGESLLTIKKMKSNETLRASNDFLFIFFQDDKKLLQLSFNETYQHDQEALVFLIDLKLK